MPNRKIAYQLDNPIEIKDLNNNVVSKVNYLILNDLTIKQIKSNYSFERLQSAFMTTIALATAQFKNLKQQQIKNDTLTEEQQEQEAIRIDNEKNLTDDEKEINRLLRTEFPKNKEDLDKFLIEEPIGTDLRLKLEKELIVRQKDLQKLIAYYLTDDAINLIKKTVEEYILSYVKRDDDERLSLAPIYIKENIFDKDKIIIGLILVNYFLGL